MLQTLCVYCILSCLFICLSYLGYRRKSFLIILCGIILYSIIFGLRYGVGRDYFGYQNAYNLYAINKDLSTIRYEVGFKFLMFICSFFNISFNGFLGIIAFLQLFLIYKSFKFNYKLFPYLTFTFMIGCIWLSYANGLRQIMAFSIFCFSLKFIFDRKVLTYYLLVLFAFMCHKSAFILAFMYPLFVFFTDKSKILLKSVKKQFFFFLLSFILMDYDLVINITETLNEYMILGYDSYLNNESGYLIKEVNPGLGFVVTLCINSVLIFYSEKVNLFFAKTPFAMIYNLYFIGLLWSLVFFKSLIFSRINYYFYGFQYIVAAFTLLYLVNTGKRKMCVFLIILYCLIFIATMYRMNENTSLFIFNWQEELFYLKGIN